VFTKKKRQQAVAAVSMSPAVRRTGVGPVPATLSAAVSDPVTPSPSPLSPSGPVTPSIRAAVPRIPADWLAWPTLSESPSGPGVVGVNFYKAELAVIMNFWGPLLMAELVVGPKGEFSEPVNLVVGGVAVGNVPHRMAEDYRRAVSELHRSGKRAICRISATPGPVAPRLLIHGAPRPRRLGDPFLPPAGPGEQVVLDVEGAGRLDAALAVGARTSASNEAEHTMTATLFPRIGRLDVQLDGHRVGHLNGRYPLVEKAAGFEYPLTCRASVQHDPGESFGLRVFVPR
jgi:hypothetical protein